MRTWRTSAPPSATIEIASGRASRSSSTAESIILFWERESGVVHHDTRKKKEKKGRDLARALFLRRPPFGPGGGGPPVRSRDRDAKEKDEGFGEPGGCPCRCRKNQGPLPISSSGRWWPARFLHRPSFAYSSPESLLAQTQGGRDCRGRLQQGAGGVLLSLLLLVVVVVPAGAAGGASGNGPFPPPRRVTPCPPLPPRYIQLTREPLGPKTQGGRQDGGP